MFKGTVISDNRYLRYKQIIAIFGFVPGIIIMNIVFNNINDIWVLVLGIILMFAYYYFLHRSNKYVTSLKGGRRLEINEKCISIKDNNNKTVFAFLKSEIENIKFDVDYIPLEEKRSLDMVTRTGKSLANEISFSHQGKPIKIHFIFDSYFMGEQLKKLHLAWIHLYLLFLFPI